MQLISLIYFIEENKTKWKGLNNRISKPSTGVLFSARLTTVKGCAVVHTTLNSGLYSIDQRWAFRYALFRYVAEQGKWEAPAIYWRYQTVS